MTLRLDRRATLGAALSLLPLITGCGGLLPKPPERQIYRLSPTLVFRTPLPRADGQLLIATPTALAAFDTARVALSRSAASLEYFADAEWVDRTPFVVQSALIDGFQNSHAFSGVSSESNGLFADFVLGVEVRDFTAIYDSPTGPPQVRVQLNAELVRMPGRKIAAETSVSRQATAAGNDIPAIVQAFNEALGGAVEELVIWTVGRPLWGRGGSVRSSADTVRSRSLTR